MTSDAKKQDNINRIIDYYYTAYVPIRFCSQCPNYAKYIEDDKTLKDKFKRWLGFQKDKRLHVEICNGNNERVETIGRYAQTNYLLDFKCPYKKCNQKE